MNKKIVLGLVALTLIHNAQASSLCKDSLSVLSWNIDTNIVRTEGGYARDAFPEFRVNARIPFIKETLGRIISSSSPDVIHIQEGRHFVTSFGDEVDSITPIMTFLKSRGYQVFEKQYNPTDLAFSYITAIKKGFIVDDLEGLYFTKTPECPTDHSLPIQDVKDNNFGEEWERCAFSVKFHDRCGRNYVATNVHLGISEQHRKEACRMLRQGAETRACQNNNLLEVITGDFNTFPLWGGPAQLKIMAENDTLQEVTADLKLENGKPSSSTFIAFPYDFAANEKRLNDESVKETGLPLAKRLSALPVDERKNEIRRLYATECKAIGDHLDRVYQRGFDDAQVTLLLASKDECFNPDDFNEDTVKEVVLCTNGPAFASDHQPLLTTLSIPE